MAEVAVEAWYAFTFHHPPPPSPSDSCAGSL